MAKLFVAIKGATAYEAQFWCVGVRVRYWRFLRVGCWPSVYIDRSIWEE